MYTLFDFLSFLFLDVTFERSLDTHGASESMGNTLTKNQEQLSVSLKEGWTFGLISGALHKEKRQRCQWLTICFVSSLVPLVASKKFELCALQSVKKRAMLCH